MESLKKSIMDYGLLQPVGISPSKEDPTRYDLVYGYRRFLAFTELGKVEIPVTIISDHPLSVDDRMRMNVVENNQRKDVTLMESGLRWRKLVEWGYDPQPITPPPSGTRSGVGAVAGQDPEGSCRLTSLRPKSKTGSRYPLVFRAILTRLP